MMASLTGVWFACARSVTPFDTDHQIRLTQTGSNRVIISEETHWGGDNSELEVARWAAGDSSAPRMIPGQTRSDTGVHVMLMYAHLETGMEAQHANESYNHLQSDITGIEGFLVYHERNIAFPGLTPVMDRLTTRFNTDRGHAPELWGAHDRNAPPMETLWNTFYDTFWGFSNNTIFMSERYNWRTARTEIQRIEDFEIGDPVPPY